MLRRLSTQQQLFLAIAGTGVFLVIVVLLGVRSYFLQNFSDYLAEQEQRRLQQVAVVLSEYYETIHRQMPARVRAEFSERELWRQVIQTIQRDSVINPERVNLDPELSFSALTLETVSGERIFGPDIREPVSVLVLAEGQIIATLSTELPTSQNAAARRSLSRAANAILALGRRLSAIGRCLGCMAHCQSVACAFSVI